MNIEKVISFDFDQNCYIIYNNNNGILIDPGIDTFKILKRLDELKVNISHILLTHCHYDHIFSVNELRCGKKVITTKECSDNITSSVINLSQAFGNEFTCKPADIILADNEELKIGDIKIKAITTPGHTDGGVCYLIGDKLFSGDTLFKRSIGRCDFPKGDEEVLISSIKDKLFNLPDNTEVYPGHGDITTIGYEKKFNLCIGL